MIEVTDGALTTCVECLGASNGNSGKQVFTDVDVAYAWAESHAEEREHQVLVIIGTIIGAPSHTA